MLQKSKSRKTAQLKYLLLLPVICGMLIYTACSNEPKTEENQIVQNTDPDVMAKIQELEDVIMEKGSLTPEEEFALQQVTVKRLPGDKYAAEKSSDGSSYNIPFGSIEKAPTYPGCSGVDNEAMKKCMSMNISQFINDNFNTKLANSLGLVGRQRIAVQFTIDKTGSIVNVRARAPKKELEDEAIRIVKLLPQMQPGEHEGKKVGVLYSLPIVFDVVE